MGSSNCVWIEHGLSFLFAGYDIFGPEMEIRNHFKSLEFQYECGDFKSSTGKKVSFLRVSNVSDVVQKSVTQLNESGMLVEKSNIPKNVLWVLLTGDKGGKSTKLLLQFLNCKEQHSVHTARLLAIYEGDKDNYECIEKVFGPVIDETKRVLANISELDLRVDLSQVSNQIEKCDFNIKDIKGIENWPNELTQLLANQHNGYYSKRCLLCQKQTPSNLQSRHDNKQSHGWNSIAECWLSLGGDWEFIARLLGLTGPNGTYFCNFCHAQIKDLMKGKPHTPYLLEKGSTMKQFPVRSFESITSDNEEYVKSGSVKSKANQFHNCESSPIFHAAGPVIDSVSCMPLHLSLGLGKQALELVESEAISIDKVIKEANGEACPEMTEAFQRREALTQECSDLKEKLDEINEAVNSADDTLQRFLTETAPHHQKEGRR